MSHHVHRLGLAGGVAVTASHNPAHWNGFKIKANFGGSATPEQYAAVDRAVGARPPAAPRAGAIEVADLATPYRTHLASLLDVEAIRRAGLTVVADAMHGAAGTLVADIAGGRARPASSRIRPERDVLFGGVQPGADRAEPRFDGRARRVRLAPALAVATDGDADRLGVLDRRGAFVSPHRILALLFLHAFRRRGLSGGIAKTFSTSLLIDRIASALSARASSRRRSVSSTSPS